MFRNGAFTIAPAAGNHNVCVTHDTIVGIVPPIEGISAGYVVVLVISVHLMTIRVSTVYDVSLALDISSAICGKLHASRHILGAPVVCHCRHRHRSRRRLRQRGTTRLRVLLTHGIPVQYSGRVRSIVLLIRIPLSITGVRLDRDSNDQLTSFVSSLTTGLGYFCGRICCIVKSGNFNTLLRVKRNLNSRRYRIVLVFIEDIAVFVSTDARNSINSHTVYGPVFVVAYTISKGKHRRHGVSERGILAGLNSRPRNILPDIFKNAAQIFVGKPAISGIAAIPESNIPASANSPPTVVIFSRGIGIIGRNRLHIHTNIGANVQARFVFQHTDGIHCGAAVL